MPKIETSSNNMLLNFGKWERKERIRKFATDHLLLKRAQLGLTQQQMAKVVGVHQSRIAGYEQGETPRDVDTALAIARTYQLTREETDEYCYLLFGYRSRSDPLVATVDIDYLAEYLTNIHNVRIQGSPKLAQEMARSLARQIASSTTMNGGLKADWLRGEALNELGTAYTEVSPVNEIVSQIEPVSAEQLEIAAHINNARLRGLAYLHLGDAHYIAHNYLKSIECLDNAMDVVAGDDKLRLLRIRALDAAYLGEAELFKQTKLTIQRIIDRNEYSSLEHVSLAYEGLARGSGILKAPNTLEIFEQGWTILEHLSSIGGKAPIRSIQLATSQIEILGSMHNGEKRFIEEFGKTWSNFARSLKFDRHLERILHVLRLTLD